MKFFPGRCPSCQARAKYMEYLMPTSYELDERDGEYDHNGESHDFDEAAMPTENRYRNKLTCENGHEWWAYCGLPQERLVSDYLAMVEETGGLRVTLTTEGREFAKLLTANDEKIGPVDLFFNLFAEMISSHGWKVLDAEELGALTNCEIILTPEWTANTETGNLTSLGRVYWHERYQIDCPMEALMNGGLFLERAMEDAFVV